MVRNIGYSLMLFSLFLVSCAYQTFDSAQKAGYANFYTAFNTLPNIDEQKQVQLKYVLIIVDNDNKYIKDMLGSNFTVHGTANKQNIIHLVGKEKNGKIYVNPAVLGHEMMHLMNFQNEEFYDPDRD